MWAFTSEAQMKQARLCLSPSSSLAATQASCTRARGRVGEDVALTHGLISHLQSSPAVFLRTAALPLCGRRRALQLCNGQPAKKEKERTQRRKHSLRIHTTLKRLRSGKEERRYSNIFFTDRPLLWWWWTIKGCKSINCEIYLVCIIISDACFNLQLFFTENVFQI